MGEFEKNQDETNQADQTDKPAFDQFDKEKGQQEQQDGMKTPQDEFADEKGDKPL